MARKTNKTAHVLNLLSGNNSQKTNKTEETPEIKEEKSPVVSTIQVDSTGQEDPVSDVIHQKLLSELSDLIDEDTPEPVPFNPELTIEKEDPPTPISELTLTDDEPDAPASLPVGESIAEPIPIAEPTPPVDESTPKVEEAPPVDESTPKVEEAPSVDEPTIEKEPEFVRLNLMERIVEDKIIYYMRQFGVCTCDRCVADTIALTLNGLQPKYLVTSPAAIAPLVSFYTNRYISDITVEATKACQIVKDHPRHD